MKNIPVRKITTIEKKEPASGQFSIRDLQAIQNGEDLIHELHRHDFFFVLILKKGKGSHEIDFVPYDVQDHVAFILRPGQVHQLRLKAGSEGFLMEFDGRFYQPQNAVAQQRWKKMMQKNLCRLEGSGFEKLYGIARNIFDEFTAKQEDYLDAIKAGLELFSIEYIRQSRHTNNTQANKSSYVLERFEELQQLLEAHISEHKNASDYASLLNLSSYQLNAITKSAVGKTISELINDQILLESKRYLLATPAQVKDIAYHLGYEDISYFIRFFKKHTGLTPEAFRKNST